jgi:hypothetical protein
MPNNNDLFQHPHQARQPRAPKPGNSKSNAGYGLMQHPMSQGRSMGVDRDAEQYNYSIPSQHQIYGGGMDRGNIHSRGNLGGYN